MMIYIHVPFCVRKCQYCDFLSFPPAAATAAEQYVGALQKEIEAYRESVCEGRLPRHIRSVFFGGGTPSLLPGEAIERIMGALRSVFEIDEQAEVTIECNPGSVSPKKAVQWRTAGINRVSMGVQSFSDRLLKKLGRIHDRAQALDSYRILREAGFQNVSLDLMSGLPSQSVDDWMQTLKEACDLHPEHLSCYSLIIEEGTPFYEKQDELDLPSEEDERAMYHEGVSYLRSRGYERYEISNFARTGYESRHNSGYWVRTPYLGLGLGSSSLLPGEVRVRNTDDYKLYLAHSGELEKIRAEIETLSEADCMSEFMFLGLRRMVGVSESEFKKTFGKTIGSVFPGIVEKHVEDGLLIKENGRIHLSDRGVDLSNQVFVDFLL